VPAAKHPRAVAPFAVARFKEPAVLTQVVFEVILIALAHSLFEGAACVTQILNVLDALIVLGSV
jgi:hypothetical protein